MKLDSIPTVGSTSWLGSCWSAIKHLNSTSGIIQEGYDRYKNVPFKIPTLYSWIIVVSGNKLLEEVRNAPDDQLSANEGTNDFLKIAYTIGHKVVQNPYHFSIIKTQLNRNLGVIFPSVDDEITIALTEMFPCEGGGRNSEWLDFCLQSAIDAMVSGAKLEFFPHLMWPLLARFLTTASSHTKKGIQYLSPIIKERQRLRAEGVHGRNEIDSPNDFLQWLIENGTESSEMEITHRMLVMFFASIHATSNSLMTAIYNLAAHPEYLKPLREEVDTSVYQDGWTKASVDKMHKVDSFLKESHRHGGASSLVMLRKVLKDFTFSDGRIVPRGCYIAAPQYAVHHDEEMYTSPNNFDPLRFVELRDDKRQQTITLSPDFLTFGHGKHACPGRFYATIVQKLVFARILSLYDLKLEEDAPKSPRTIEFGIFLTPDPSTRILLRKRVP
ncbi:hypothetical protein ID866_5229 [Astraeus odoratus]|nr:hypothetical protein ID866_5229 [Astraeus odoratus]